MPLPMGTQSVDVFDRAQGGLLILGAPGAGFINFLDYAAEHSLLRKVGGGTMFGYALLLDYFVRRSGS